MAALENVHCEHYFNYHVGVRAMHNGFGAKPEWTRVRAVSEPARTLSFKPANKGQGRARLRRAGNLQQLRAGAAAAAADVKIMFSPPCFPYTLILAVSHFQFYDLQRVDNSFICFLRVIIGRISASAIALGAAQHRQEETGRRENGRAWAG